MPIEVCDVPSDSVLDRRLVEAAFFRDSYRAPLAHPEARVVEIFWPIFYLGRSELVAGRDNRHLDFRLSVLKEGSGEAMSTVISTVCTPHNTFGRLYLILVIPFHKWGVKHLMSRAVAAGRL